MRGDMIGVLQVEEKTPVSVMSAKKEASAIAGEVAEKVDKVTTPVVQAVAPKRVSFCSRISYTHGWLTVVSSFPVCSHVQAPCWVWG